MGKGKDKKEKDPEDYVSVKRVDLERIRLRLEDLERELLAKLESSAAKN